MTARKTKENDATLPLAALQLLAPPVRLVSAALWKVMEQRDVMHYGVVEEFVTSLCETVPGLLTVRHQGKLALGLRARLIMELCSTQPDKKEIMSHLERIRAPAAMSTSSATTKKRDLKIMNTVEAFQSLVHLLLTDTTRRTHFFKEEFPVDYGPKFDQELEKLLWEFLIRLDQFLPVPNLAQTVSWLSETPSVLEACARAASQPQLLQTLLQHQTCLGHLETAASLPPNMGDSILTSLSLPPSGKVPSDPPTGATNSFYQSYNTQTRDKTPFIKPVIGLISNEDVPFMIRTQRGEEQAKDATNEHSNPKENFTAIKPKLKDDGTIESEEQVEEERKESNGLKRKQPDMMESDSDDDEEEEEEEEEEEILGMTISGKKRISNKTSERVDDRAALKTCMMQLGVKKLPEDPSLCSLFGSCLRSQPKVILHKLSVTPASPNRTKSSPVKQQNQRRTSPVKTPTRKLNQTQKPGSERPGLGDKETQRGEEQAKDATNEHSNPKENFTAIKPKLKDDGTIEGEEQVEEERKESNGMKHKQPDMMESDSEEEEEEEILGMTISGKKRISNKTSERVDDRAVLKTCMMQLGIKKLPEDPSLCSLFGSCLRSQPKVILHKLSVTPASPNRTKSSPVKQQNQRRTSPVKTPTRKLNQTQKPGSERPGLGDKENHPVLPGVIGSPAQQRSNSGTSARPGDTEDYVADSEDEATKNFKVRLFTKRYYKTKHGTYVPTLREYWKPGMTRRDFSSVVGKNRR
ncbi:TERF1-interacting nuclear factor 2 isoform X2 [Pseudochaenichthys georgianus]|uniref:TERF1-interacting nuclear factor 2 isoform X2 n=1 Tax=Pseudochaenichthys georgianus TaxID=52239 RepID=UPI00146A4DA7|nr:muscle M-line assembly protein unc-89 isoform X2 [Pseudochaenichthys georgianus]